MVFSNVTWKISINESFMFSIMSDKKSFTEKAKDMVESVKDKITGHHHSKEDHREYSPEGPISTEAHGGMEEAGQFRNEGLLHEPGQFSVETHGGMEETGQLYHEGLIQEAEIPGGYLSGTGMRRENEYPTTAVKEARIFASGLHN